VIQYGKMTRWAALLIAVAPLAANDELFLNRLWPVLERAQCRMCHNDNGVASTTRLQFPAANATQDRIRDFGVGLARLVDRARAADSLLLNKPTNRITHGGGERIAPGSDDERALRAWVDHLVSLPAPAAARQEVTVATKPVLRRLTHSQYNHTVRDLLGDETNPASQFPKEDYVHGFTNQAEGQSISPLLAEAYQRAAERLARNAFRGGDHRKLVPCNPSSSNCAAEFIRTFGRRAFRRPLAPEEVTRYLRFFSAKRPFVESAQLVSEAMLVSPHFLFLLAPEPYGLASRLSYFLWDTLPDDMLLDAAAKGELNTAAGVEKQVRRLLADSRARASLDVFLAQWLRFDRLQSAIRDRRLYPEFTTELVAAMTEETRLLFQHLVWNNGDFREFFSARYSFVNPELAAVYGVTAPARPWDRVAFAENSPRGGILGQATFLSLTSKPEETSPTERGLFIREHFLCQSVPPPPAGVNTTLPPVTDEQPMTNRQRLDVHLSNQVCAGCHQLVDPIGFGFEAYDAIGKFRTHQVVTIHPTADDLKTRRKTKPSVHELTIEPRGFIRGLANSEFTTPRQLGERLANEPACHRCVAKQIFRYAMGRPEEPDDRETLDAVTQRFSASQFRFNELIIAVATSKPFLGGPD
jgi:hypothetical protein